MRLRCIALLVCLSISGQVAQLAAQEPDGVAPTPAGDAGNLAAPTETGPPMNSPNNPFRDINSPSLLPESQSNQGAERGQPGFAEATDQNLFAPSPSANQPSAASPLRNAPPMPTPVSTSRSSSQTSSNFSPRLARAAPIMGDTLSPALEFVDPYDHTVAQIPTGGSATRRKIGENTGAIPMDRFIFNYNHFQNALDSIGDMTNIDRYTLGIEKTFMSSLFSIDARLPLSANNDYHNPGLFSRNGSELGNLSMALKVLLTSDDDSAIVAGLVVDTPTGGGTTATLPNGAILKYNNDAVHLAPFLGFLCLHGEGIAHQGFLQVDVPTNANGFVYSDPDIVSTEFEEQSLLYFDYSVSKAIYQAGRSSRGQNSLERVSALAEFHYTTTLEDSDVIQINTSNSLFDLSSQGNRIDVLNMTLGLDTLLSCGANLRFGTVVPLTDDDDRFFDIEFQAQLNFPL